MNRKQNTASQNTPWYELPHESDRKLHIIISREAYEGSHIEIIPECDADIPKLNELLYHNFRIANPLRDFWEMSENGFEDYYYYWLNDPDSRDSGNGELVETAMFALSDLWESPSDKEKSKEHGLNVLQLLNKLLQWYLDYRLEGIQEYYIPDEEEYGVPVEPPDDSE